MKKRQKITTRIMSLFLALCILSVVLPAMAITASAAEVDTRVVDLSTLDDWTQFFGEDVANTENAGGIWTDKSVFTDASAFPAEVKMNDPDNNFLVALSAIAANKSITGYSHIPTDTMLVLDISRSMGPNTQQGDDNNDAVDELITAANAAIAKLQAVNNYNRVGVVLYSGNYTVSQTANDNHSIVLLPLGRYEHSRDTFLVKDNQTFVVSGDNVTAESVKVNSGVTKGGTTVATAEREVYGGTYIQGGIHAAMREFLKVEDTTIEGDGFQAGTKRIPITVLMSDGLPTIATNDYNGTATGIGTSNLGDGGTPENELATAIPFVTQLTASYAKQRIEEHYERDSLFFTLGFKIEDSPVLDPDNTRDTDAHWSTYENTADGSTMQLAIGSEWVSTGPFSGYYRTIYTAIEKSSLNLTENYVNQYFQAEESLTKAFDAIVAEIILQSLYYPTQVNDGNNDLDGYIEFIDDIGQYMEVKDIKGILLGDILFKGDNIAKNFIGGGGDLGTIENPSALGDEMIRAVKARLGIKDTVEAQRLVDDAYKAGQLAYDPATGEYSNYIGWYADADGNYMGHGTRDDDKPMDGAVFYNESYGYLGEVIDGHKVSDMMYVSVQVHTRIATGTSGVIFKIPASLIPVVSYNITLTGDSIDNPGEVTLEVDSTMDIDRNGDGVVDSQEPIAPIRLLFEVGLKDEINELTVADIVGEDYKYEDDGTYTFYTNRWNPDDLNHAHPSQAENTVAFYEPNEENERYYYTENATVYRQIADDEYVPYTGAQSPAYANETFYRQYAVFEQTNNNSTNNARVHLHYEAMSSEALGVAKADVEDGKAPKADTTWYVPKGTIHRMFENYHNGKGGFTDATQTAVNANLTNTLIYSHYLGVELVPENIATDESEASYYADVVLGNNGLMTLDAAQGIKITKEVDATLIGRDDVYTFEITSANELAVEGEYRIVTLDASGNKVSRDVTFATGTETVNIKAGEAAYLLDVPIGAEYLIEELTAGKDYEVATINDEAVSEITVSVVKDSLVNIDVVNTLKPPVEYGNLIIQKLVEHPLGAHTAVPEDIEFNFEVEYVDEDDNEVNVPITLTNAKTALVTGIPVDTEVTITEVDIPAGFISDKADDTVRITVEDTQNYIVTFTNTYIPEAVSPDITVHGDKTFTGREDDMWLDTDNFTFKLQKRVGTEWVDMVLTDLSGNALKAEATVTKDNMTFDFSPFIQAETYSQRGVYSYRVVETFDENPYKGITYDTGIRWFDIYVDDLDWNGQYEVTAVIGYGGAEVRALAANALDVDVSFTNTYAPAGSDAVSVIVNKAVEDKSVSTQLDSIVSAAGFEFGLYQEERLIHKLPATSAAGETLVTLNFGANDIGKNIQYTLKEIVPDEAIKGMQYSQQEYIITVEVKDDTEGGVIATVIAYENVEGATEASGDEVAVDFINTYDPEDATAYIAGTKTLVGREITDGEFTFELYAAEDATYENIVLVDKTVNNYMEYNFEELTFSTVGEYYYLVKEKVGSDANITYDTTEYKVTVRVTDVDGELYAEVLVDGDAEKVAEFTNIYSESTEPVTTEPTEPVTTEPTEPVTTEPTEPVTTEPVTTKPTEPVTTEPTEPVTTEPTEPVTTEATEPPTTASAEPPASEPVITEPPQTELPGPDVVQTSDSTNPLLWVAVLFVSGGLATTAVKAKKRKER